jgi:hypothetical protein
LDIKGKHYGEAFLDQSFRSGRIARRVCLCARTCRRDGERRRLSRGADQAKSSASRQRDSVAGRRWLDPSRRSRRYPRLLGNQLVRTRQAYAAGELAILVADATTDLSSAVSYMAAIKSPVTVIATSRGTIRAAEGIARGARPDALVLTSGFLSPASGGGSNVMSILGTSASLPHTLVIHHRQVVAGPHCRPGLIRSSNGRQAAPA